MEDRAEFIYDAEWNPERMLGGRPDVVLCVNDWPYEVTECLDAARSAGIPSVVLQDGILEWRCQYENPLFGAGGGAPQHQPVLADKIACIGSQSARQIAAWGNAHKAEVTGMPRLDHLVQRSIQPRRRPGTRILVMTAKNPGFTPEQRAITLRSLQHLKAQLNTLEHVEVAWRISNALVPALGVNNHFQSLATAELVDMIEHADAVITTPSTVMLEAMLLGRPVCALDYHNVPRFVPTAWTITAREHIESTVRELLDPPPRKLAFQRNCLDDCLAHPGLAARRVGTIIEAMATLSRQARAEQSEMALPASILESGGASCTNSEVSLSDLYPGQPVFADTDIQSLQVRVARLQKRNAELKHSLNHRSPRDGLYRFGRYVAERIRTRSG